MGQPLGIVDVLISGEASLHGLPEKSGHLVNPVCACLAVGQRRARQIGQAERGVHFPHEQQTAVRTELRTPELQPHATVKIQPQIST
jgi:hypothetical protein